MVLALMLFLAAQPSCPQAPQPSNPPVLVVEVVDPLWLPLPGMQITVRPKQGSRELQRANTDANGTASFWVPSNAEYDIEAWAPGFKKGKQKAVRIGVVSGGTLAARVQIRLRLAGPNVTVY